MPISARMNRLFAADGRCLVVAMDHGVFHEPSFLPGLENLSKAVGVMLRAMPDALQLTPGQAHLLQQVRGPRKPALVLRLDTTNVYSRPTPSTLFSIVAEEALEQAIGLDAAAVVVNLIAVPGAEALHGQCLRHISQLRPRCEQFGVPLMVEPLVLLPAPNGRMLESSLNVHAITSLTRQAVEMGADLIKVDATERPDDFARVVEAASGKPVLVRGGSTMSRDLLLSRSEALLKQGARGFVFGRNILQDDDPQGLVAALLRMLHGAPKSDNENSERSHSAAASPKAATSAALPIPATDAALDYAKPASVAPPLPPEHPPAPVPVTATPPPAPDPLPADVRVPTPGPIPAPPPPPKDAQPPSPPAPAGN
jgi:fructose-bisphosphate aldolase, class I